MKVSSSESDDEGQEGVSEYINAIQGVRKKIEAVSSLLMVHLFSSTNCPLS